MSRSAPTWKTSACRRRRRWHVVARQTACCSRAPQAEAIVGFKLQGVDLSNIRTSLPGEGGRAELQAVTATRALAFALDAADEGGVVAALERLNAACSGPDAEAGAVEAAGVCPVCSPAGQSHGLRQGPVARSTSSCARCNYQPNGCNSSRSRRSRRAATNRWRQPPR